MYRTLSSIYIDKTTLTSLQIGIFLFAGSTIICYQCMAAYTSDTYALHSASASAACSFFRSMSAFIFPLVVPYLFGSLGYGVGGSLLGGLAVVLGIPIPFLLWFFGPWLRRNADKIL